MIDDDSIARDLLCSTLEAAGHIAYGLPSSIGATRCIFENRVNVVVLDVMMPNINGDKIAKVLRNNPQGSALAIVLVSGRSHEELRGLADAAQADAVVSKRNIRSELVRVVTQAVKRRELQEVQRDSVG